MAGLVPAIHVLQVSHLVILRREPPSALGAKTELLRASQSDANDPKQTIGPTLAYLRSRRPEQPGLLDPSRQRGGVGQKQMHDLNSPEPLHSCVHFAPHEPPFFLAEAGSDRTAIVVTIVATRTRSPVLVIRRALHISCPPMSVRSPAGNAAQIVRDYKPFKRRRTSSGPATFPSFFAISPNGALAVSALGTKRTSAMV